MFGLLRVRWLFSLLPRTISYFFSERVPFYYKLVLLVPIFWQFTPVARISNVFPVAGLLDEFTIILLTMALFTYLAAGYLRRKAEKEDKGAKPLQVIEGEYYIIDTPAHQAQVKK